MARPRWRAAFGRRLGALGRARFADRLGRFTTRSSGLGRPCGCLSRSKGRFRVPPAAWRAPCIEKDEWSFQSKRSSSIFSYSVCPSCRWAAATNLRPMLRPSRSGSVGPEAESEEGTAPMGTLAKALAVSALVVPAPAVRAPPRLVSPRTWTMWWRFCEQLMTRRRGTFALFRATAMTSVGTQCKRMSLLGPGAYALIPHCLPTPESAGGGWKTAV
jgi:hypothetical protein